MSSVAQVQAIIAEKTLNILADNKPEKFGKSLCEQIKEQCDIRASIKHNNGNIIFSFIPPNEQTSLTSEQQQMLVTFLQEKCEKTAVMVSELTKTDHLRDTSEKNGINLAFDALPITLVAEGNSITFSKSPMVAQESPNNAVTDITLPEQERELATASRKR